MLAIEQKYKDLYNQYGGKEMRLIFFKDSYNALYPSETLYPSNDLYPAEMGEDSVAFEITNDMIHTDTLSITESLCSEENLDFGACECSQMEIVVSDVMDSSSLPEFFLDFETGHMGCVPGKDVQVSMDGDHVCFIHDKKLEPYMDKGHVMISRISVADIAGLEFMLEESFHGFRMVRGIFTVESVPKEADRNTRKIIAYDRMKRFDADVAGWYNSLEFPMTLKQFRDSLCAFVNVHQYGNSILINDDMIVEKTLDVAVLNGRDVMRYICQINGVFGNMNINGELRYVAVPKKDNVTDVIDRYKSVESEEYTVPDIDTVIIRAETNDVGGVSDGDGMNSCIIEGNFLAYGKTTAEMAEIANNIKSLVSGLEYRPAVIEGNSAPWYEMGDRISVETSDGVVNTIIMYRTSTGINGAMDTFESTGSQELGQTFGIRSEIIQTKGMTAILKRTVEEVSNELKNFEEDTESKFTQTAHEISLRVRKGEVSAELSVEPDKVTIKGNRLIVESTNFQLDGNGNATFSGDVKGASITGSTISGNTITGSTITGSTINGGTITGSTINGGDNIRFKAQPGKIQVGDFYVDDEYGRQIFQSYDECTGMSTGDVATGKWYLWAGYGKSSYGSAVFLVSRNQVRIYGDLYVNDVKITSSSSGGSSGGCSGDCDDYDSCPIDGCVGLTCGPGDV